MSIVMMLLILLMRSSVLLMHTAPLSLSFFPYHCSHMTMILIVMMPMIVTTKGYNQVEQSV